jgi:hypothetical protein
VELRRQDVAVLDDEEAFVLVWLPLMFLPRENFCLQAVATSNNSALDDLDAEPTSRGSEAAGRRYRTARPARCVGSRRSPPRGYSKMIGLAAADTDVDGERK